MTNRPKPDHVFINCPFDSGYQPMMDAIVFAVFDLGFVARSSLETNDAGQVRVTKIERIIGECLYGIHDISAVELDKNTKLPRFNMPLELGMFLGCRTYGGRRQEKKRCLILDQDKYRYRKFISDISGNDIAAHGGKPQNAIREVRRWLADQIAGDSILPGEAEIVRRYSQFQKDLPRSCAAFKLAPDELTFVDRAKFISRWLNMNR